MKKLLLFFSLVALVIAYIFFYEKKTSARTVAWNTSPSAKSASNPSEGTCKHLFVSWNLENFGKSKTPEALEVMSEVLRDADIVAAQEVNAGKNFGAQGIATLADLLSRKGANWDYVVSSPTLPASFGVERYAFLIKKNIQFSRDSAHLLSELQEAIDREPFSLTVTVEGRSIKLFTMHTVPTEKVPYNEIKMLPSSKQIVEAQHAIFSGDFNLPAKSTDTVFDLMGYTGWIRQKTSLKGKLAKNGDYLFHQYDNVYTKGIHVCESGVIDFVAKRYSPVTQESLQEAHKVSDHLPVYIRFE